MDQIRGGGTPNDRQENLADQAERCRRLSRVTHDRSAAQILERMAADYEFRARANDD